VGRRNAKDRSVPFAVDGEDKRRQAAPAALDAADRPVYDVLENLLSGGS
jgi:hypothetical protein